MRLLINAKMMFVPLCLTLASQLSACGGGGSGTNTVSSPSTPAPAPTPTPDPTPTALTFSDITSQSNLNHQWGIANPDPLSMAELFASGIAAGDIDKDGDIDLFVNGGDVSASKLFINNGDNTFAEMAGQAGLQITDHKGSGSVFADLDGDSDLDLFIGGIEGDRNYLFENNGDGTFTDVYAQSGITVTAANTVSAAFGDYDKDGYLDMALSHWGNKPENAIDSGHLWRNQGSLLFAADTVAAGIRDTIVNLETDNGLVGPADYTFTANFADLNNDGFPDLTYVADFANTQLYMNNQNGTFINTTNSQIRDENGMGSAIGDYDNDGDLDWFVTAIFEINPASGNVRTQGNRLYQNQGDGSFLEVAYDAKVYDGAWGWGACFADFNNDGYLDIFHTNGWGQDAVGGTGGDVDFSNDPLKLFISNGDGTFSEQALEVGLEDTSQGRGIVCFDSDNDGDIDLVINSNELDKNSLVFYQNDHGNQLGNFLNLTLTGDGANTQAIGARVYVTTDEMTQMREVMISNNFVSQNPTNLHFGVGQYETVDQVRIVWTDGSERVMSDVDVNQSLNISQAD